jgi:hypothetical protein
MRNAFRGGEVDVASNDIFAGIGLEDVGRLLVAFTGSKEPLPADRNPWTRTVVPSVNAELNIDIPASFATTGAVYVKSECHKTYPDRYQTLVKAFVEAGKDPAYHAELKKVNEWTSWSSSPARSFMRSNGPDLKALVPIVKEIGIGRR